MTINDVFVLPVDESIIDKTAINTIKKYNYTNKSLMYNRTPVELLDNLYMGDLAKNSLFSYLKSHCKVDIIDYDDIRTDRFENSDPGWDFLVGNKKIKVEVKSSTPPNGEDYQSIINNRDIKITASHDRGKNWIPTENIESDIHVQIYFYAKPYRNGYESFEELSSILEKDNRAIHEIINSPKYNQPLFFGFNTKKNIIIFSKTLEPNTWTFSWTDRIYWRCPISKSFTLSELITLVNSL